VGSAAQVVFRVDASIDSGAGHVMRCLTLAQALHHLGAVCRFVCREHPGHLIAHIREQGHEVLTLPAAESHAPVAAQTDDFAHWLGADWSEDARQTQGALAAFGVQDWLVVDHYGLDEQWERAVRPCGRHLLVIDDLANRRHDADILLDQTFGRDAGDYQGLTNPACERRCGIDNVLLRHEFEQWRHHSLTRRTHPRLERIVISMGGVDKDNMTRDVLLAIQRDERLSHAAVCVVLGANSPWIHDISELARHGPPRVHVHVAVSNMAELLANCDLAIGAAGTSSWERCCLGVPTLMFVLADNQREVAARLSEVGAARLLQRGPDLQQQVVDALTALRTAPEGLRGMSKVAASLVPRSGAGRLARAMLERAA
jgi:UDP-2,4-diacetamido-2,4,6-trideoxy-beta-L-altropyranose hydrolase